MERPLRIGVLAVQGDFEAHASVLHALGAEPREVRTPEGFADLDGVVLPGGESTTLAMGMARDGLDGALRAHVEAGRAVLGTCAGLILLDDEHLGLLDATVLRNAYGRQLASFEADLEVRGLGPDPIRAVFIRAPRIERAGPEVDILATHDGHPVAVRQGNVLACAFHPELADDSRFHAYFLAVATEARKARV